MLSSTHCHLLALFAQSHLHKNIYNFTIPYINNSLPTRTNMTRWGLSQSPDCSFYLNPESLLHIDAGCQHYLDRLTWRHDSILNFIANSLQPLINDRSSLYADVNGFPSRFMLQKPEISAGLMGLLGSNADFTLPYLWHFRVPFFVYNYVGMFMLMLFSIFECLMRHFVCPPNFA